MIVTFAKAAALDPDTAARLAASYPEAYRLVSKEEWEYDTRTGKLTCSEWNYSMMLYNKYNPKDVMNNVFRYRVENEQFRLLSEDKTFYTP